MAKASTKEKGTKSKKSKKSSKAASAAVAEAPENDELLAEETEAAEEAASHSLQILGGQGYLKGNPAEEGYRDAKYLQIAGTSSEISRMKIADGVLGI